VLRIKQTSKQIGDEFSKGRDFAPKWISNDISSLQIIVIFRDDASPGMSRGKRKVTTRRVGAKYNAIAKCSLGNGGNDRHKSILIRCICISIRWTGSDRRGAFVPAESQVFRNFSLYPSVYPALKVIRKRIIRGTRGAWSRRQG